MTLSPLPPGQGDRRYALGDELGRGGMGVVRSAADRDLRRRVALKCMLGEDGVERFLREAQMTAQLEHPNIVPVHDVGLTADGRLFFTMKLVGGRTFGEALGTQTMRERLEVLLRVCDAIAFAHARGVIHRDLKPANVMVGEFGEVLVMDWGLAKLADVPDAIEPATSSSPSDSMEGDVLGTPSYMAPEQARGEPVDARADVYALGAMLYQVLSGRPPIIGDTAWEVVERAQRGEIGRPDGPPELVAIAMKALTRDREQRYATAKAFQDDLRRYLEGREVSARRDPLPARLVKWIRRNPIPSASAAAAVLALGIGIVATKMQTAASQRREREARAAGHEAAAGPLIASGTIADLVKAEEHLREAEKVRSQPRRYEVNRTLGERAIERADYELARLAFSACRSIDPARAAGLEKRVEEAESAQQRERAGRIGEILGEIVAGLSRPERPKPAGTIEDYVFEVVGFRDEQTVRLLADALEPLRGKAEDRGAEARWDEQEANLMRFAFRVLGRLDIESAVGPLSGMMEVLWEREFVVECGRALCHTGRATALQPLMNAQTRLDAQSAAWRGIEPHVGKILYAAELPEPEDADGHNERGLLRLMRGDPEGALTDFTRSIELDPNVAGVYGNRGIVLLVLGRFQEALEDATSALQREPKNPGLLLNRAWVRGQIGDLLGAVEDLTAAIEVHPTHVLAYNNRGNLRYRLADYRRAIEDFSRALELDPNDVYPLSNRGSARLAAGDVRGAIEDQTRAIEVDRSHAPAYNNRGLARVAAGDLGGAIEDYTRAVELDSGYAIAFRNRAVARARSGDPESAIADYTRAIGLDPNYVNAMFGRGVLLADHRGDLKGAIADWERGLELEPDHESASQIRQAIGEARRMLERR